MKPQSAEIQVQVQVQVSILRLPLGCLLFIHGCLLVVGSACASLAASLCAVTMVDAAPQEP